MNKSEHEDRSSKSYHFLSPSYPSFVTSHIPAYLKQEEVEAAEPPHSAAQAVVRQERWQQAILVPAHTRHSPRTAAAGVVKQLRFVEMLPIL